MKIDVEGFEVHVLEGMGLDGANLPCYIWIEIVDGARLARLGSKKFSEVRLAPWVTGLGRMDMKKITH